MRHARLLIFALLGLAAMGVWLHWWRSVTASLHPPAPIIRGRAEGCLVCHDGMTGFSAEHRPARIGCSACHLGDPGTSDKKRAHTGVVLVPGGLDQAVRTCGASGCHPLISSRIQSSLMATGRGLVAVDRFVFGEADSPDLAGHLSRLGRSPADLHLKQLCAACHLSFPKEQPEPISESSRGGGCTACHLHYTAAARQDLTNYLNSRTLPRVHPALTVRVTDGHCFGCHSRSGRISLNYTGWHEVALSRREAPRAGAPPPRTLADGRTVVRQAVDVHQAAGLECVDCHTWRETMGDGQSHRHEEEAVEIACRDCHFQGPARTVGPDQLHAIEKTLLRLRGWTNAQRRWLAIGKNGHPILNSTFDAEGRPALLGKNYGTAWRLKPPAALCTRAIEGHERLSCQSCHAAWAPHCIQCHTQLERRHDDDLEAARSPSGTWVEYAGDFRAEPPTLGVREASRRIEPFIPGMILTLNTHQDGPRPSGAGGSLFRRLYAPIAPHTTAARGRSCLSCHADPLALGYGRGRLVFQPREDGQGEWVFEPAFPLHPADGLPQDAWIGFLSNPRSPASTRLDARPLSVEEQRRVLTVGACLQCHPFNPSSLSRIYSRFTQALTECGHACRTPIWPHQKGIAPLRR